MRRIVLFLLCLCCFMGSFAQDRVNEAPKTLSYKSKEIRRIYYWEKQNGKWKSRFCYTFPHLSGVQSDNFSSIFIGNIDSLKFLFIDYNKAEYKYPNLEMDWTYYRKIRASLISDEDYANLKNIQQGEIVRVITRFSNEMYKNHQEYSFPLFLKLTETLYSAEKTLYKLNCKEFGQDYADNHWKSTYPEECTLLVKRTTSENKNVVRFNILIPVLALSTSHPFPENYYFELPYEKYMELFDADRNVRYK